MSTRQPTPANILADVLTADVATPDRTALRNRLRWDYSQVAPVDRKAVEDAAVDILANGQRAMESASAAGRRLIEAKRILNHGQFGDWIETEFGMTQRMAQMWMNIARTFDGKSEIISLFSETAIALLAAPSTPEPAREQAIQEAQNTGKSPSVQRTKEIIAEHKPGPVVQPITTPTVAEYSAAVQAAQPARPVYSAISNPDPVVAANAAAATVQIIEYDAAAPLPQRADEPVALPRGGDSRIERARHLIDLYLAVQAACDEAVEEEAAYEALVGTPSDLLAANRCMRQLPVALAEPIAKLRHLITIIQHPQEAQ